MLDGFIAAIVAGPATYEPFAWLCPLIGVTRHAINNGDTEDYAAIAGVAEHHNAISATLSDAPQRFVPIFERDAKGAVDVTSWCRGFYAAIQLNTTFWRELLPARGQAHPVAAPDSGALRRRPRPASPRCPAARAIHRSGTHRRQPRNSPRRYRHP
jgi:uncharacterized protein